MKIVCYPNRILAEPTPKVTVFDQKLRDTAKMMFETMYAANGVGLAAPQVGLSLRMAVICTGNCPDGEVVLVNPEIIDSQGKATVEEGCLSFPGIYVKVSRHAAVKVQYQDLDGATHVLEAEGLLARAVQHELDHLDGVLLYDHMSPIQRMANRRALRMLELRQASGADPVVGGST
jgi:peptide deformylase